MARGSAAGLAAVLLLAGCFGGGGKDDGTLDPVVLGRIADRATFQVRMPARLGTEYRLLSVGRLTGENGHYGVDFDVVAGDGPILSLQEAENAGVGVIRTSTKGASLLGRERLGDGSWSVYDQPSVGGLVYARRYEDGVEVVLVGDAERGPLRALARALDPRS